MKKLLLSGMLAFAAAFVLQAQVPTNGLVAHYRFDGDLNDASGNGYHATAVETATYTPSGQPGGGDAIDMNLSKGASLSYSGNGILNFAGQNSTYSVWVKLSDIPTTYTNIIENGSADNSLYFRLQKDINGNTSVQGGYFANGGNFGAVNVTLSGARRITDNTWTLLTFTSAVVFEDNSRKLEIYVNGQLAASQTIPAARAQISYHMGHISKLNIGCRDGVAGFNPNGLFNDVYIYNRALTANEVSQMYRTPASYALVAKYRFDGDLNDASGNGYHATAVAPNTASYSPSGQIDGGDAMNLSSGKAVYHDYAGNLGAFQTQSFTYSAWVKLSNIPGNYAYIIENGSSVDNTVYIRLNKAVSGASVRIEAGYNKPGGASSQVIYNTTGASIITNNTWTLLTLTSTIGPVNNSRTSILYVNGVQVNSVTASGGNAEVQYTVTETKLNIGGREGQPNTSPNGLLNDVSIYNRALSATEVTQMYNEYLPLNAPSALTATASSSPLSVALTWADDATNEDGYIIERSTDGTSFTEIGTVTANTTSYSDAGVAENTTYHYRVRAYSGSTYSDYSNAATVLTPVLPIAAPTALTATASSSPLSVALTWADDATNEDGYIIERSTDGTSFTEIGTVTANTTSYSDAGVAENTTYYYRVRAYSSSTYSDYSDAATVLTPVAPIAAPTALTATASSSPQAVELAWEDNATNESGYKIERSIDGGRFTEIATVVANTTSYSDAGVAENTTYHYRVRAYSSSTNSDYSDAATVLTPVAPIAAPTALTATASSSPLSVELAWEDNATNESGYKIERSIDGSRFTEIATVVANATSYSDAGVAENTTYHYRVRAYSGSTYSDYSDAATVLTPILPIAAPTALTATLSSSPLSVALTWTDDATNEDGYIIERSTDGTSFAEIGTVTANATSYSDAGVAENTTYYYRVYAYSGSVNSDFSNTVQVTIPAPTYVIFADANFKNAVLAIAGLVHAHPTEITVAEAAAFTGEINVNNKNISDLTGLESFVNITALSVAQNNISVLNISNNKKLTSLAANTNMLSGALDLSQHTSLTALTVNSNSLTSLNLKNGNNHNFTYLNTRNNPDLICIDVDNVVYSSSHWVGTDFLKDLAQSFGEDCNELNCRVIIPNERFRSLLIGNHAINTNLDAYIQCSEAAAYTGEININGEGIINNLTGLEAFVNITSLIVAADNGLTSLDISNHKKLIRLVANSNDLRGVLDLSQHTALTVLSVNGNNLTGLNVKNGNNHNFIYFNTNGLNQDLHCIEVDNAAYSTANWTGIDFSFGSGVRFNEDCSPATGTSEVNRSIITAVYPNPANAMLTIEVNENTEIKIVNMLGATVRIQKLSAGSNSMDVSALAQGVYFLHPAANSGYSGAMKFVKE